MHQFKLAGLLCLAGMSAIPALADEMKSTMSTMKSGEVVAVMPDGHMGTMMAGPEMMRDIMKMAKPLDHCMMMMTGTDGKTYTIDTSTPEAQKECEKMAM